MEVTTGETGLYATIGSEEPIRLMYQGEDRFVLEVAPDVSLRFQVVDGQATRFILDGGPGGEARRVN